MDSRFLQSEFWAKFKESHGWKTLFFACHNDGTVAFTNEFSKNGNCLVVLVRTFSIKFLKLSIAYIPMAPEKHENESDHDYSLKVINLSNLIKSFLPKNTICIRYDFPIDYSSIEEKKEHKFLIRKSHVDIQPPDTVLLSLNSSEDELLANMKSKWRYNIRLAEKKGVQINSYNSDTPDFNQAFNEFYKLFEETSKRDGVNFHARDYYLDLLNRSSSESDPKITLYLAKHENDYLAGIITLFCKKEAVYLYGASGNIKRNFMPAYLLQWTAIKDAMKYGCPVYDFYGIPPTDNENHPMHGLFLFKTGFGGKIVHRPGSFDFPLRKILYFSYSTLEKMRSWFFKVAMKKIKGR